MDQQPAMTGSQIIDAYIADLDAELALYNDCVANNQTKPYKDLPTSTTNRKLTSLFPDNSTKQTTDHVQSLMILFARESTHLDAIKKALVTKKGTVTSPKEAEKAIGTIKDYLDNLDTAMSDVEILNGAIAIINPPATTPKEALTDTKIVAIQNNQILKGARVYQGADGGDVNLDFYLVKQAEKVYCFYQKNAEKPECSEIKTVANIEKLLGAGYATILLESARDSNITHTTLSDPRLITLLSKLEQNKLLVPEDKSLLFMISEVFSSVAFSNLWKRPLNMEEAKDFLRFLTGKNKDKIDPAFLARLTLCNQGELNKIKTTFGVANSFASEFFQGSSFAPSISALHVASSADATLGEADKKDILDGKKYCWYNVNAGHAFGLVFGNVDTKKDKRKIYIQDSTERNDGDILTTYKAAIAKIYPEGKEGENYEIVRTTKKKDSAKMFAETNAAGKTSGIENQCRYSAIIFSERVILGLAKGDSFGAGSIKYGEKDFVDAFAGYFDKSAMGIEASSKPKRRQLPPTPKQAAADDLVAHADPYVLLQKHGATFDEFWTWRKHRDKDIKAIRDQAQTQGLNEIRTSKKPFVVIQAVNDRPHLWEQRAAGIQATKAWLVANSPQQECLVINNSGGHWDSTRVSSNPINQHIESSGANLACGCYTLMNIVIQYSAHADQAQLNAALAKLTDPERATIRAALNTPDVNSSKLDAALVRKFTQAAIQVLPSTGAATKAVRDLAIKNVVRSHYQLATEELGMALEGLGIKYIEQSALGQIHDAANDDQFLQQNVQLNLLGANGPISFRNQMHEIAAYIGTIAHPNPPAAGLPAAALPNDLDALIASNPPPDFTKQFLIPADFIFYCEAIGLKTIRVDNVDYFRFLKDNADEVLIPTINTAQSKIYLSKEIQSSSESEDCSSFTDMLASEEIPITNYNSICELLLEALNKTIAAAVEEKPKPIVAGLNPAFANATYIEGLSDHMPVSFTVDGKRILTLNLLRRCTSSTTKVNGDKVGSNNPYNVEETPEQYAARFRQQIRFLVEAAKTHDFIALQEADVLNENPELLKELLLALSEDYGITRETGQDYAADSNDKKHLHPRGLATIYNKKKYTLGATTLHCEINKAPKAQSPYKKHHAMITAYTTKDSGELISVGNMHLDSEEAKTQIAELNKALLTTNLGVIVGDTNSPRVANASCFGIDEATCYDSIAKVKNGCKVKDTVSAKIPGNGGPKTAFHGTDDAALAPTNKTPTKKSYDVALIKAGPTKDIDAWVNAGKYVSVADEKEKFTDYSIQPKVTIARGKSYDLNEKPSPKPKIADAETLKTTAAIKNAISELVDPKKTPDKDNAAVKAAIKDKFEAALETQKAEIAPKKAYRGIGLEANVVNLTKDFVALKIGDIFEEGLASFFADDEAAAIGVTDLQTKLAGKFIIGVDGKDINDLASKNGGKSSPQFLKKVVEMFHGAGNLEFTVIDKFHGTSTQIKCERNIFVAHTCDHPAAKTALTAAGKKGAQYNPDTHGIEALAESEKITKAATDALVAANSKSK